MNETSTITETISKATQAYSEEPRPLRAYLGLVGIFNLLFAAFLLLAKRGNRPVPERVGLVDIVTLGIATHKASRLLAKDSVTSPMRAPFTTFEGPGDMAGEVSESPRGTGWRYAVGELVT